MGNDFFTNEQLTQKFGLRPTGGISLFEPAELGWLCPIDLGHHITWSEFENHIWCYVCQKDYFTLLCPKEVNPFTTVDIVEKELKRMRPLMDEWTLDRYKGL